MEVGPEEGQLNLCPLCGSRDTAPHKKVLRYDVQVIRFWCILTATENLVLADD